MFTHLKSQAPTLYPTPACEPGNNQHKFCHDNVAQCKVLIIMQLQVNTGSGTHREPERVRIAPKATFKAFQLELNATCVKREHMRMRQRLQNAKNVSCLLARLGQY